MEPKEYKLETIQDIANMVTVDNLEKFISDFRAFLLGYMSAQVLSDMGAKKAGTDKIQIPITSFVWIDDDKTDVEIKITCNELPGESINIRLTDNRTAAVIIKDEMMKLCQSDEHMFSPFLREFRDEFFYEDHEDYDEDEVPIFVKIEFQLDSREDVGEEYAEAKIREVIKNLISSGRLPNEDFSISVSHIDSFTDGYNSYVMMISLDF